MNMKKEVIYDDNIKLFIKTVLYPMINENKKWAIDEMKNEKMCTGMQIIGEEIGMNIYNKYYKHDYIKKYKTE